VKKRIEWVKNQQELGKKNVYFLDESSVNCGMIPLYGWGKKSERVNDYVPDMRFKRTSIIGILGLDGFKGKEVFKGTLNGERFGKYVKGTLSSALKKGDVLELDNLSVHKVKNVLNPLYEKGIEVVFCRNIHRILIR
jgi:hypothetical protein